MLMKTPLYKTLSFLILAIFFFSCEEDARPSDFEITTSAKKNAVVNGGEIKLSLKAKKNTTVDSISYSIDGVRLGSTSTLSNYTITPTVETLGHKKLNATVYTAQGPINVEGKLIILNTTAPKIYSYEIVNRYPHQRDAYTQGLEFVGDELYESTGQYGESKLRKVNYTTCLLYTSPSPRDQRGSRMPSSA